MASSGKRKRAARSTLEMFDRTLYGTSSEEEEHSGKRGSIRVLTIDIQEDNDEPKRGTPESAAFDVWSATKTTIPPKTVQKVPLKLNMAIPEGYFALLVGRSGLATKGLFLEAGLIDSDYRGQIQALLYNSTDSAFPISTGQRVAQMCVLPVVPVQFVRKHVLPKAKTEHLGFGSTGMDGGVIQA